MCIICGPTFPQVHAGRGRPYVPSLPRDAAPGPSGGGHRGRLAGGGVGVLTGTLSVTCQSPGGVLAEWPEPPDPSITEQAWSLDPVTEARRPTLGTARDHDCRTGRGHCVCLVVGHPQPSRHNALDNILPQSVALTTVSLFGLLSRSVTPRGRVWPKSPACSFPLRLSSQRTAG